MNPTRFALAALFLSACSAAPVAEHPFIDRTLSTTAEAEVKVAPDQAVLTLEIKADAADASKAIAAVDVPTAKVLAAAKRRGVEAQHLQSAQVMVQPRYVYDARGNAKQQGVTGTRTVTIVLCALPKLDLVVQEVLAAGDVSLQSVDYQDSKMTEHKELARIHAAEAARRKASSLAERLGAKLGPPRTVSESGAPQVHGYERWQSISYNVAKDVSAGAVAGDTFAAGQVTVSAGVQVVFDLEI